MTVPSESEFQSFLEICHWKPRPEWMESARHAEDDGHRLNLLLSVEQAKEAFYNIAWSHQVTTWLINDTNVADAYRSLKFRRKLKVLLPLEKSVEEKIKRLHGKGNWYLENEIQANPCEYISELLSAFYHYFYTNRWQKVTEIGRDADEKIEGVVAQIEAIENKLQELRPLGEFYLGYEMVDFDSLLRDLGRIKRKITTLSGDGVKVVPTRRKDERARERVLVFDLARVVRRNYGKDRPAAIANFVRVEGIHNPPDQRTIERLIKSWKTARGKASMQFEVSRAEKRSLRPDPSVIRKI